MVATGEAIENRKPCAAVNKRSQRPAVRVSSAGPKNDRPTRTGRAGRLGFEKKADEIADGTVRRSTERPR